MPTICIFGASSTWGAGDLKQGGWTNRLRLWIDEQNIKDNDFYWETYNLGVSDDTSQDALNRIEGELSARKPKIIIISIGDNDTVYSQNKDQPRIDIEQYGKNIEQMIAQARKYSNNVLFLGLKKVNEKQVQPVSWNENVNYSNESIKAYDKKLQEVADHNKVNYLSIYDLLNENDLADGLHPNEQGHQKIFESVKTQLEKSNWLE